MKLLLHMLSKISNSVSLYSILLCFLFSSQSVKSQVILNIGNAVGAQDVTVDITVENWDSLVAAQFTINWDPNYLSMDSIGNLAIPDQSNFGNINNAEGYRTHSWIDPMVTGISLDDGTTLFTLYFTVLQEGFSAVDITGSPTAIEFVDYTFQTISYIINAGSVNGVGTLLQGNVYHDLNDDCAFQNGEAGLENWLIKLSGDQNFYTSTHADGDYSILVDTGDYIVELIMPTTGLWLPCDNNIPVDLSGDVDPYELDLPVKSIVDCALMEVDISVPFLRRCFSNYYTVNYCNIGTVTAVDPSVEIELDPYMTVVGSSEPYTINGEGLYVFELEDLEVGDCGSFVFEALLDCDSTVIGQTHCVLAHAYPDSLCIPPAANWSGASLLINGTCTEDEVQFTIQNTGADMMMESHYIVIEDAVMYTPGNFILAEGATMPVSFPANGSTYRFEVGQVEGHPGNSMPSLTIEGCGTNDDGEFSLGFVNQFSEDDNDPWISIDCQQNIGAYDPNDKAAFPVGYGPDHYIKPNTDIEYKIRFQNTGTDTAFNVVVEDTLSVHLDPVTVRPGASSHPYAFELTDQGLLRFSFDNIMLPDSNINEPASHGFVKFRVSQIPDLPDGTLINNEAAIYFDFNEAVWTNQTFHEVQREFVTVSNQEVFVQGVEVKVYPNPFSTTAIFEIKGKEYNAMELRVFDSMGRMVSGELFDSQPFEVSATAYTPGLYFYQILSEGSLISNGKLIVH